MIAAAYIGLVCLLPRGMGRSAAWIVSVYDFPGRRLVDAVALPFQRDLPFRASIHIRNLMSTAGGQKTKRGSGAHGFAEVQDAWNGRHARRA